MKIGIIDLCKQIEDPRMNRKKVHKMETIIYISIAAVICGAQSWNEIEEFGNAKIAFFKSRIPDLEFIPSHDTFNRFFSIIKPEYFELIFRYWVKEVCQFLRAEERLNAELKHGHYDNFFDSEEEWLEYELEKLREYITDYINGKSIEASDLYPIKEFIQHLKFQKLLDRYDDLYSMDMFGESIEGHKYKTPYQVVKMINPNSKEDMELLREVLRNNNFDDEDE